MLFSHHRFMLIDPETLKNFIFTKKAVMDQSVFQKI